MKFNEIQTHKTTICSNLSSKIYPLIYIYIELCHVISNCMQYFCIFLSRVAEILARKFAEMFDSDQDVKNCQDVGGKWFLWRPCYHAATMLVIRRLKIISVAFSSLSHVPYRRGTSITSLLLFIGRTGWSMFRSSLRWCNLSPWQVGLRARTLDMPSL